MQPASFHANVKLEDNGCLSACVSLLCVCMCVSFLISQKELKIKEKEH